MHLSDCGTNSQALWTVQKLSLHLAVVSYPPDPLEATRPGVLQIRVEHITPDAVSKLHNTPSAFHEDDLKRWLKRNHWAD